MRLTDPAGDDLKSVAAAIAFNNRQLRDMVKKLPGAVLAYEEVPGNVTVTSATEAAPTDVVSAGTIALDGRTPVAVKFFSPRVLNGAGANAVVFVSLWDGTTQLGRLGYAQIASNDQISVPFNVERVLPPPAVGDHEYLIRAHRTVANGLIVSGVGGVGADLPAFVQVTVADEV